ncbi:MAG: peptidylprolyl isomerase [Flavobacteriales bacterium]
MALIENIRKRQGLLLAMVGLGMLSFLIPYDAVMSLFGQGANREVGSIDGNSITALDYQNALQKRRGLFNYTSNQALENEVWNDLVEATLLSPEYDALGLDVSQEEFDEIRFGDHISTYVKNTFYGGNVSQESRDNWRTTFANMFNDETGPGRANYNGYVDVIVQKRLREKYDVLVNKGLYANSLEAKYEFVRGEEKVNIDYVLATYKTLADSLVTVKDSDVRALYNKRKSDPKLKQQEARDLEYIKFTLEPSAEDITKLRTELEALSTEWRTLDNDTNFVTRNNSGAPYISRRLKENQAVTEGDKSIFTTQEGEVVGPYEDAGRMVVVKPVRFIDVPDSAAKCRHILLSFKDKGNADEVAELKARADSLRRRLRAGDSFDDLVTRFSEDPGSKTTGGVYDFFPRGQMVKPFEDFCFDNAIGTVGSVETTYGIHLVEVLDQRWTVKEAELAELIRTIAPSAETRRNIYNTARDFATNFRDEESFRTAADTMGYALTEAKNVLPGASNVGALRDAYEVINWSMKAEKGTVSTPLTVGNDYIVALLTKVMKAGEPSFENIEDQMREEATKAAKAKYLIEKLKKAENLEQAAAIAGTTVKSASGINLKSGTITGSGVGQEPKVAGLAFAVPNGSMSLPIEGEFGVWVIAPTSEVTPAAERDDYFAEQEQATTRMRGGLSIQLLNAIKSGGDVKDQRTEFNQ